MLYACKAASSGLLGHAFSCLDHDPALCASQVLVHALLLAADSPLGLRRCTAIFDAALKEFYPMGIMAHL